MQKLQLLLREKDNIHISFFDLALIEDLIDKKISGASFIKSKEVFEGFNSLQKSSVKLPNVNAILWPYQEQGFQWLNYLHQNNLVGCLADDIGFGKHCKLFICFPPFIPNKKSIRW